MLFNKNKYDKRSSQSPKLSDRQQRISPKNQERILEMFGENDPYDINELSKEIKQEVARNHLDSKDVVAKQEFEDENVEVVTDDSLERYHNEEVSKAKKKSVQKSNVTEKHQTKVTAHHNVKSTENYTSRNSEHYESRVSEHYETKVSERYESRNSGRLDTKDSEIFQTKYVEMEIGDDQFVENIGYESYLKNTRKEKTNKRTGSSGKKRTGFEYVGKVETKDTEMFQTKYVEKDLNDEVAEDIGYKSYLENNQKEPTNKKNGYESVGFVERVGEDTREQMQFDAYERRQEMIENARHEVEALEARKHLSKDHTPLLEIDDFTQLEETQIVEEEQVVAES